MTPMPEAATKPECRNCRFWTPHISHPIHNPDDELALGECHRYAPPPSKGAFENLMLEWVSIIAWRFAQNDFPDTRFDYEEQVNAETSWWPGTWASDWCGEHKPKEPHA